MLIDDLQETQSVMLDTVQKMNEAIDAMKQMVDAMQTFKRALSHMNNQLDKTIDALDQETVTSTDINQLIEMEAQIEKEKPNSNPDHSHPYGSSPFTKQ